MDGITYSLSSRGVSLRTGRLIRRVMVPVTWEGTHLSLVLLHQREPLETRIESVERYGVHPDALGHLKIDKQFPLPVLFHAGLRPRDPRADPFVMDADAYALDLAPRLRRASVDVAVDIVRRLQSGRLDPDWWEQDTLPEALRGNGLDPARIRDLRVQDLDAWLDWNRPDVADRLQGATDEAPRLAEDELWTDLSRLASGD